MTKPIPLSRAFARATALLGACLLVFACPAAAFTTTVKKPGGENTPLNLGSGSGSSTHSTSGGASIVRTIVGLAIVIAVIWGLSWILRQVKAGKDPQAPAGGLSNVAALPLGSGRTLHLVRAGSDYVLLGAGEHGLFPIHRYTEEQAREAGLLSVEVDERPPRRRITAGLLAPPRSSDPMGAPAPAPAPGTGLVERMREWTVRR
jgi:flagellar protein FliO/FliZ